MGMHHSAQFKAQVVRAARREEKTLAQLASEYGLNPAQVGAGKFVFAGRGVVGGSYVHQCTNIPASTQISTWKTTALQDLPRLFERRERTASQADR